MGGKAGCLALIAFLLFCDCLCSVALLHGALVWSAVRDCGIFRSYSLALRRRLGMVLVQYVLAEHSTDQ